MSVEEIKKTSTEEMANSSEVSFDSSEVSFDSSEVLFLPSVENFHFPVSYWEIPPWGSEFIDTMRQL